MFGDCFGGNFGLLSFELLGAGVGVGLGFNCVLLFWIGCFGFVFASLAFVLFGVDIIRILSLG